MTNKEYEKVIERIRSDIESGKFNAGSVESSISSILNLMMQLKMFNKKELFDFRINLDKMICYMLIDQNENLDKIANRAEAILRREAKTPKDEREIDVKFHYSLLRATGNRMLITVVNSSTKLFADMIASVRDASDEEMRRKLEQAHLDIVNALRNADKPAVSAAINYHYKLVDEIIKKAHLKEYLSNRTFPVVHSRDDEKDPLTGLLIREAFFKKFESYRLQHPEEELVLWVSDIQGLRFINERYGIEIGDKILVQISKLGKVMGNFLFGGRVNGDKLVAVMQEDHADFEMVNQMLMKHSNTEFPIKNVVVKNGVYHVTKDDKLSPYAMYVRAEMALLSIKDSYTKSVQEYDDSLRNELIGNMMIEEDAEEALVNEDFKVYLQPKVSASAETVDGAEALVRWIHPERGFMNPGAFIKIFEQTGFITKLDLWMWESVCKILNEWKTEGRALVPISVNMSRNSFQDEKLAEKLIAIADNYGIEHNLLEIEVTEYACLDNEDRVYETIAKIHREGFGVSLDDFGTGYSSMVVISKLDIDYLKLDMSLIRGEEELGKRSALEFAIQLAKMMKLRTVAEGIETEEHVSRIRTLGADYIQGYYYSKPLPRAEFEEFIKK